VSDTLAISAVTAAFGELLKRVLENPDLAGKGVTIQRPIEAAADGDRRLNLFLFQVTPNAALRDADLPTRDRAGALTRQPVVALNLHYLVTSFGKAGSELDAHYLLGHAMSIVHDNGVLTRAHIRNALKAFTSMPELSKSDLADQLEPVRLTPLPMTQEEHFKLWSTFNTPYRLSVGYEASLVMIERKRSVKPTLPVRTPVVAVVPLRRPRVESVTPQIVTLGEAVVLAGQDLTGPGSRVRFGTQEVPPTALPDGRLKVMPPASLRAGVQTLQVVHQLRYGKPPGPRAGFESNTVPFVRAPRITTAPPISVARNSDLTLAITPPVGRAQRAALLLGDRSIAIVPRPVKPDPSDDTTHDLTFPIPADMPTGTFLARVQIDGADSPLELETDPNDPRFDQYVLPVVTVT
jgi:hypothetical protein